MTASSCSGSKGRVMSAAARSSANRDPRLLTVTFHRGIDGSDPLRAEPISRLDGTFDERRSERSWELATGTLACPHCDAPVSPPGPVSPSDPLACPYCGHGAATRDFLSLGEPTRPARVVVRVVSRVRAGR